MRSPVRTVAYFTVLLLLLPFAFGETDDWIVRDGGITLRSHGRDMLHFRNNPEGKSAFKPYVDLFATSDGRNILRDGPDDHLHHHGLMFAAKVDGVNFWEENEPTAGRQIVRPGSLETTGNGLALDLDWVNGENATLLQERRQITLRNDIIPEAVLLDWASTLSVAENRKKARIHGSHYNGLGIRFDRSMDAGGRFFADVDQDGERIRGTENLTECRWMAYVARLDGKPVTVALFDDPDNFRKMSAFTMGGDGKVFAYLAAALNLHHDPMELSAAQTARFHYGVCLWEGERLRDEVEKACNIWQTKNKEK